MQILLSQVHEIRRYGSGTCRQDSAPEFYQVIKPVSAVSRYMVIWSFPGVMIPKQRSGVSRLESAYGRSQVTSARSTLSRLTVIELPQEVWTLAFGSGVLTTGKIHFHEYSGSRVLISHNRQCLAILQGHTSLVGQLQMSSPTLVSGGSDGSVRVWSLETFSPIHRLAAHDNSVTSLQFDEHRIVSGGSDGRVKVWDLQAGTLIRELSQPAEAVWRVAFESETAVVMASRNNRMIMEVWDFRPQEGRNPAGDDADQIMTDVNESSRARSVEAADDAYATDSVDTDSRLSEADRMDV